MVSEGSKKYPDNPYSLNMTMTLWTKEDDTHEAELKALEEADDNSLDALFA